MHTPDVVARFDSPPVDSKRGQSMMLCELETRGALHNHRQLPTAPTAAAANKTNSRNCQPGEGCLPLHCTAARSGGTQGELPGARKLTHCLRRSALLLMPVPLNMCCAQHCKKPADKKGPPQRNRRHKTLSTTKQTPTSTAATPQPAGSAVSCRWCPGACPLPLLPRLSRCLLVLLLPCWSPRSPRAPPHATPGLPARPAPWGGGGGKHTG